jgi:hypothetical protein
LTTDFIAMVSRLLIACVLMAICVTIHAGGMTAALENLRHLLIAARTFWRRTWLFITVAVWIVLLHLVEMSVWALVYFWNGAIEDLQSAFYFSAVTYTTTGYGDVLLPHDWRLAGGVEALTGILMCGWSTAFFFAIVSSLHEQHTRINN